MKPLVDSFGRQHTYLRISVTDRCNLRCIYCMPPQGINIRKREEILNFDEIERVSRIFAEMGVTKIRLTGGEPLVRKNLPNLISRLANLPGIETIGMTTNGVLLKENAHLLKDSGLTKLNISLDTLRPDRFEHIALRNHYVDVQVGINMALAAGFVPLKLNVVVMKGINDDEILDFVEFVRDKPINVRFIEYMPFKFNQWNHARFISYQEMKKRIERHHQLLPLLEKPVPSAVAKDFRIGGFVGTVSFITPMSDHFCDGCNRLRLMADGSIKSCLFHPAEVNLLSTLRSGASDETIAELIHDAVKLKPKAHPRMDDAKGATFENRTMIEIGG